MIFLENVSILYDVICRPPLKNMKSKFKMFSTSVMTKTSRASSTTNISSTSGTTMFSSVSSTTACSTTRWSTTRSPPCRTSRRRLVSGRGPLLPAPRRRLVAGLPLPTRSLRWEWLRPHFATAWRRPRARGAPPSCHARSLRSAAAGVDPGLPLARVWSALLFLHGALAALPRQTSLPSPLCCLEAPCRLRRPGALLWPPPAPPPLGGCGLVRRAWCLLAPEPAG